LTRRSWASKKALVVASLLAVPAGCGGGDDSGTTKSVPTAATTPRVITGANVVRIPGRSPADVASAAVLAVYPDQAHQPKGLVLAPLDWRYAAVASQFAADPVSAAVLPTAGEYLAPGPSDLVERLRPSGFPRGEGLKALVLGKGGDDVFLALRNRGLKLSQLRARTLPRLVLDSVPFRGGWARRYSDQIVAVAADARDYALPGIAWSAYSGDTAILVGRDSLPDASRQVVIQRQKLRLERPTVYVIGPPSAISESVADQLRAHATVKRVAGPTPAATSVALARYKDRRTGFGWGLARGPANVTVMNRRDWRNLFGAIALAGAGPQGPLLLTDEPGSLPGEVLRYLRSLRGGRGSQAFVLGEETSVDARVMAEIDQALAQPR
jgi:hypothetical protein